MRVVIARKVMVLKGLARAALLVSTSIAKKGGPSSDMIVVDLDETLHGSSSGKVMLNTGSAEIREKNALKEAGGHCVPVECNAQE